jgi:transposase InsO family protein
MIFTMRYTAHPERRTRFQNTIDALGLLHATCQKASPWQNGIVERSHRTDNEELFNCMRFASSEERRYFLWHWEKFYNTSRPHQGLGGRTPKQVFEREYPIHSMRMLT